MEKETAPPASTQRNIVLFLLTLVAAPLVVAALLSHLAGSGVVILERNLTFTIETAIIVTFLVGYLALRRMDHRYRFPLAVLTSNIFLVLLIFSGVTGLYLLFLKSLKWSILGHSVKYWHVMASYLMVFFGIMHFSQSCTLVYHTGGVIRKFFGRLIKKKAEKNE
ncbi:hypothetical protein HZB03_04410 [Candidatus Woesearchaeota archaeon]|nr:hypothetical protein [Candidatus Woesearchaeota archaeon]